MTALHWAVFHKDARLVELLLKNMAEQVFNAEGLLPVDIAGLSGSEDIVKIFARSLETDIRNYKVSNGIPITNDAQVTNKTSSPSKRHQVSDSKESLKIENQNLVITL